MRKLFVSFLAITGILVGANAAPQGRSATTSARGAVSARSATPSVSVRSATPAVSARSAVAPAKSVSARAATTTQKVINSGTKIASATQNTAVNEECQNKYYGCMDAFCMLDNTSGGRCLCSDRNAELDTILNEIEKLDQQTYEMATLGVEQIEMGENADIAIAKANAVADSVINGSDTQRKARQALDLSAWDTSVDFDDDDIFAETRTLRGIIDDKTGDALQSAANELCVAQIPECAADMGMLQLLYAQRIKSDCSAYENSLKQRKSQSQTKLNTAQKALREAALEQYQNANKYDLGQCTIQFKKCMQTTGGCGDDFSNCASIAAMDNTNVNKSTSKKVDNYSIKGSSTTIEISASTYDTLVAKKPLCETVTKSCVAVADQVWDTFLREIAPTVKSAEIIAEDNVRQNCIGTISSCFQKACKDNIDPNDPSGSYDMCLTRPETMLNLCKVPLNACGIDTSKPSNAEKSQIWEFVVARLASMRVDSCTKEVKSCLQSEDRCGSDYTQCVGLDTDTIMRMCPYEKLVGCQNQYDGKDIRGNAVYDEIATMVQGIMLNIDNNMLTKCQQAANDAMIKVCGDTENCDGFAIDNGVGGRSLEYKICEYSGNENSLDIDYAKCRTDVSQIMDSELGRVDGSKSSELGPVTPFAGVLDGVIYWENIDVDEDGKLSTVDEYLTKLNSDKTISEKQKEKIKSELAVLQQSINNTISAIESDLTVQYCMTGREVPGMKTNSGTDMSFGNRENARFPELTKQMRSMIALSALKQAKNNYYARYNELNDELLSDYVTLGERMAEIKGENGKDARRELARQACLGLAEASAVPKSSNPPRNVVGTIITVLAVAPNVVVAPFTTSLVVAGVIGANYASPGANGADGKTELQLVASKQVNQWNYKETVTSTFEWETLNCQKCVRSQSCSKTKNPLFGSKYCATWGEPKESCDNTQF